MAVSSDNTYVASPDKASGGLRFRDLGVETPLPTDPEATPEGFLDGGYISEDGVTKTVDASDDNIIAWGGDTVRVVRTEHNLSYQFTFLESSNLNVLRLVYGDKNVTVDDSTGAITVKESSALQSRKAFLIETFDGDKKLREVIPNGQLAVSGDITYVHSDVVKYECTITAFPDPDAPEYKAYTYRTGGKPKAVGVSPEGVPGVQTDGE